MAFLSERMTQTSQAFRYLLASVSSRPETVFIVGSLKVPKPKVTVNIPKIQIQRPTINVPRPTVSTPNRRWVPECLAANCNLSDDDDPRMPKGFKKKFDKKGWRH